MSLVLDKDLAEDYQAWSDMLKKEFAQSEEGPGVWRTVNGRHIFIREGENFDTALKRSLAGGKEKAVTDYTDPDSGVKMKVMKDGGGRLVNAEAIDVYWGGVSAPKDLKDFIGGKELVKGISSNHFVALDSDTAQTFAETASEHGGGRPRIYKIRLEPGEGWAPYHGPRKADGVELARTISKDRIKPFAVQASDGDWVKHFSQQFTLVWSEHAEENGVWRTVRGRRVFIREGETPTQAVKRSIAVRTSRALVSYVPITKEKRDAAEKYEASVAKAIGGKNLDDHEPFDVIKGRHAVEVKAIMPGAKSVKATVHPESLKRKLDFAKVNRMKPHIVVIDARGATPVYYYRDKVGSFRLSAMKQVTKSELKRIFV